MNYINITVRGKIARAEEHARVVCGNSDYTVRFDFDEEWAEYALKTARFVTEDGSYTDVQFEGSDCTVPILRNTRTLLVGVFAGNLRTTTAALIHAVPCITDPDGTPADPTPDVYNQLMERFDKMEAPAAVLYTPQELTDEQKATARENIGVATPDWEQNDATAADYIKNRPFYDNTVIVPFASTPTTEPWQIAPAAADEFFNNLSSYTVRYSGTDYHFDRFNDVSWRGIEFRGVGGMLDDSPHSAQFTSNDIPFVIFRTKRNGSYDGTGAYVGKNISTSPEDQDITIFRSNIKQIDPKFIPDNRFAVTVSLGGSTPTADKTFAEVKEAHDAGRTVVMNYGGTETEVPLNTISGRFAEFVMCAGKYVSTITIPSDGAVSVEKHYVLTAPSDATPSDPGTASAGTSDEYSRADHVHPRELPECSDADAGKVLTVAGKADVQWQLPSAGADASLNITGATVGQIAKITAVDDSGKPTAWEAVDMPTGGGGDLSWIEVADITTEEQTQQLIISTDTDGRPISRYNALEMISLIYVPADATQTSTNGNLWIYPYPKIGTTFYRYVASFAAWGTTMRTQSYAWAGSTTGVLWTSASSSLALSNVVDMNGDADFMSGLCVYVHQSGDHIPAGTRVRIAVLSKGVTA